jgi:hypothetical protein
MITVIFEVSSDRDIAEKKWEAFALSASQICMKFKDTESHETVETLYFYDGEFSPCKRG